MYNKEYHKKYYQDNKHKRNKETSREATRRWRAADPERRLYTMAKARAKRLGFDFDITKEDIVIPSHCPILLTPLLKNSNVQADACAALDRIDNNKGYVKGNVRVISHKANRHKADLSIEDIKRLYEYTL